MIIVIITFSGEFFEEGDALGAGGRVKAGGWLVKEHDWGVVDELESDSEPLSLTAARKYNEHH